VPVPERHVVQAAGLDRLLQRSHGDRLDRRGVPAVDLVGTPVRHEDPHGVSGFERRQKRRQPRGVRTLGRPRDADHLDAGNDLDRARTVEDHDGPALERRGEVPAPEHRGHVQWIVIARQHQHRHRECGQGLDRAEYHRPGYRVVLEHVARDHHELCPVSLGQPTECLHGREPVRREDGLGLVSEEPPGHTELPIG